VPDRFVRFLRTTTFILSHQSIEVVQSCPADQIMLRIPSRPARLLLPGLLVAAALIQACGSDSNGPAVTPPDPRFSLSVGTATISLSPGSATGTFIKATRSGGLAGAITYEVSGAPTGLTVSVVPTSVSDSSTLAVTASAALTAGTYQVTVNASAPGAPAQQTSITVMVTAATGETPLVRSVVAGALTCALTTASVAYCWGYNNYGQLGNGDTSLVNPTPIKVSGGLLFAALFVSKVEGVTCGVTPLGVAYCWGNNGDGELGDGTRTNHKVPTPVTGGLTFRSFAVGTFHTCGVVMDGTAYCWGFSNAGAFGDGTTGSRPTPTVAAPGMKFDNIVAGQDFTCGLTLEGGAAYCWGRGPDGELGNGTASNSATPVPVSGGLTFQSLTAAGLAVCGLTTGGKAYCWGDDFFGTLGDGSSATDDGVTRRVAPVEVAGGLTFKSLSAGYRTVCGVVASGAGYCWGYNYDGAVGDGTLDTRSRPTPVSGGLTFQSIGVGTGQTCGVTTASALYCWGGNNNGELGDGTTSPRPSPGPVRWP
jgi:alpha-tubulin suppressor-like RCC1 family protein